MTADVAVIGAGVFGAWTAWHLQRAGLDVTLYDCYGPANSRASSGGESRIIRAGYGPREIYTRWSIRSMELWTEWTAEVDPTLLHRAGALWIASQAEPFAEETAATLASCGVTFHRVSGRDLAVNFPQFALAPDAWCIYEPDAGALMARRAVQTLVERLIAAGVRYERTRITVEGDAVCSAEGDPVAAGCYVFACGPWLGKLFPDVLGTKIVPSRQEVLFFGSRPGDRLFGAPHMPCWIDIDRRFYGIPDLENRGFKLAHDTHGPVIDPDTEVRQVTPAGIETARAYLAERFPRMADAPLVEARVCQYENTANGDYLLDRHPHHAHFWLVGGGSGHGFKHGPSVGEYMAGLLTGSIDPEPRFSLESKPDSADGGARSSFYRQ
jgi:glycine/D-amino acid oxidase-like deaminating enzyme